MRKIILSLIIVFILFTGSYLFYNFKTNNTTEKFTTFEMKDLNSNPKVDVESIKKIEKWYQNSMLVKPQQ